MNLLVSGREGLPLNSFVDVEEKVREINLCLRTRRFVIFPSAPHSSLSTVPAPSMLSGLNSTALFMICSLPALRNLPDV